MSPIIVPPMSSPADARPDISRDAAKQLSWRFWVLVPIGIFLIARLVSSSLLITMGEDHPGLPGGVVTQFQSPTTPLNLHTNWDAQWYLLVVDEGYPRELPRDESGHVEQNQWAFFPVYPAIVAVLVKMGLTFGAAGILVSLVSGAWAMVLLFRLLISTCDTFTATVTVTALSFSPAGLVFGLPYSESLALALILLCLTLLGQRRPVAFLCAALLLSMTRPVAPAMGAVVGVLWALRWLRRRREPFPPSEQVTWFAVAFLTAAFFLIWPAVTGLATGEWKAYALTQQAWMVDGESWDSWVKSALKGDPTMLFTGLVLIGALAVALRYGRRWPPVLRAWTVLYPLFILGASRPTPSIIRYLTLTAATAWPVPELSRAITSAKGRVAILLMAAAAGTGLQVLWLEATWLSTIGLHP